jgi:hypothetical protein
MTNLKLISASVAVIGFSLAGCDPSCPSGTTPLEGRCVEATDATVDAGTDAAAVDGGADARATLPDARETADATTPCGPCPEATPLCQAATGLCVGCLANSDCPSGVCSPSGQCVGCLSNSDCTAPTPTCNLETNTCEGCAAMGCPDAAPWCSATTGGCASCLDTSSTCSDVERLRELRAFNCRYWSGAEYIERCVLHNDPFWSSLERGVASGVVHVSLAECLAATPPLFLSEERHINENLVNSSGVTTACVDALSGTLPTGASCANSFACASGYCRRAVAFDFDDCGVCTERGGVGASCGDMFFGRNYDWQCRDGLICNDRTHQCQTQPVSGGSCGIRSDCASGSSCLRGTCIPTGSITVGTPCSYAEQCNDTLFCATATSTCQPRRTPGQSCSLPGECVSYAACMSGQCVRLGSRGDSCATTPCDYSLVCVDNTCQPYPSAGEPCRARQCGTGLVCGSADTCLVRVDAGDVCSETSQCPWSTVCAGTCRPPAGFGEACDRPELCREGTECREGVCARSPDLGESCTSACLRGMCVGGTCSTPPAGAECAYGGYLSLDPCGATGQCFYDYEGSRRYLCAPSADEGEACVESARTIADRTCEYGSTCRSGRCVAACSL